MVLADSELRLQIAAQYPQAWSRIQQRRSIIRKTFDIELHDEVLPLSNTDAHFPRFWLAPRLAMVRT